MNTNRTFSFSRLGLVMKRDFMENWKANLYTFLGMFIAFLLVYLTIMNNHDHSVYGIQKELGQYINSYTAAIVGITSLLMVYFASEMMKNMRTKEQRLSCLMLPATSLEKFVSRGLYVTVGLFVMILLASLLAEIVHYVFIPFFDELPDTYKVCVWPRAWANVFPDEFTEVLVNEKGVLFGMTMGGSVAIWWHSLYILGGNYFGRYAFFKTTGVMILVAILLAWGISHVDMDINPDTFEWLDDFFESNKNWLTENFVAGAITFIFLSFTILNWWLSYKLFTRQQVIKPKFCLL